MSWHSGHKQHGFHEAFRSICHCWNKTSLKETNNTISKFYFLVFPLVILLRRNKNKDLCLVRTNKCYNFGLVSPTSDRSFLLFQMGLWPATMACSRPWTCPTTTLWRLMTTLYQVQDSKLSGNYHGEITNRCDEFFIVYWQSVLKGCIRELSGEGRGLTMMMLCIMMALRSGIWCNANVWMRRGSVWQGQ